MVRDRMQASQSRQKTYADRRRRPLEFAARDHVFLRVTRTTGVGRALRSKKISPKFLGPYQISKRIRQWLMRLPYLLNWQISTRCSMCRS